MNSLFWSIAIAGLCMLLPVSMAHAEDSKPEFEQDWQVILMQGQRVGYVHSTLRDIEKNGETLTQSDVYTNMSISRFGQTLVTKQSMTLVSNKEGEFLSFVSVMDNPPNSHVVTKGTFSGDKLTFTTSAGGTKKETTQTGMKDIVSPSWADEHLKNNPLKVGEEFSFTTYSPQMAKKSTTTMKRIEDKTTKDFTGKERKLKCIVMTESTVPGIKTEMYLDDEDEIVKITLPILSIEMHSVSEEEALKPVDGGEMDLAIDTLVRVEPISKVHVTDSIVYRIQVEGSDPKELFVNTDTQTIKVVDEDEIDLTINAIRPDSVSTLNSTTVDSQYLAESRFLECKAPLILKLAEEGDDDATEVAAVATALEKFVHKTVTSKNFSTAMATALETANSKAGDCSEHAVLLAALLRAKKIPSRVAIGFVYSPRHSAFAGHMWTEAHIGDKWVPLDATLAKGGIGSGHITVSTSALSDDGGVPAAEFVPLMHLLRRTKISVVKQSAL